MLLFLPQKGNDPPPPRVGPDFNLIAGRSTMPGVSRILPVPYFVQPTLVTCQSTVLKMMASYIETSLLMAMHQSWRSRHSRYLERHQPGSLTSSQSRQRSREHEMVAGK